MANTLAAGNRGSKPVMRGKGREWNQELGLSVLDDAPFTKNYSIIRTPGLVEPSASLKIKN